MTIVAYGYGLSPGSGGGPGGCTVELDPIEIDIVMDGLEVLFPPTITVLDQIDLDIQVTDVKVTFLEDPPAFVGPLSETGSVGGEFFAQKKQEQRIRDLGWTIIKIEPRAGQWVFQVYGGPQVVRDLLDFGTTILYIDMQYNLYRLDPGHPVTSKFIEDSARNDRRII
jgi:hypothetical protein